MAQKSPFFELIRPNHNIDFVGKSKWWFALSTVLVVFSLGMLVVNHYLPGRKHAMNLSTDFRGGTEITMQLTQKVDPQRITSVLQAAGIPDVETVEVKDPANTYAVRFPVISTFSEEQQARVRAVLTQKVGKLGLSSLQFQEGSGTLLIRFIGEVSPEKLQSWLQEAGLSVVPEQVMLQPVYNGQMEAKISLGDIEQTVRTALEKEWGVGAVKKFKNVSVVGPKAGKELRDNGIVSLLVAIAFIMLYILVRFDFSYAPGTVIALLHDAVLVLGAFVITYKEFSLTTIAALLTVIGYSMNDTIVVFDRIRENAVKYKDRPFRQVVNLSINETLSRTILTSATVFFVTLSMNIFGTGVIRDFGFAMNVGVIVGTYSSIFIASPVLIWLHDRSAKKKRSS